MMFSNIHTGSVSRRAFGTMMFAALTAGTLLAVASQAAAESKSTEAKAKKSGKLLVFRSGVTLSGRSKKDPAPYRWFAVDIETKEIVNKAEKRWGFLLLPPGKYLVVVQKHYNGNKVPWAIVDVKRGKKHSVDVCSGLELNAQTKDEKPPYKWYAVSVKSKKIINYAERRWGFLPLTPGKYKIFIQQDYNGKPVEVGEVTIKKDQVISS